ncbi:MAG: hypothetical protein GXP26_06405 [Planctomycetes bacterium]|nr:hypothetical protein [Planctomycetota bacterium]
MRNLPVALSLALLMVLFVMPSSEATWAEEIDPQIIDRVEPLVRQLNDDKAARRDQAEQELIKLAPVDDPQALDAYLLLLPKPIEGMPEEVRSRLSQIRHQLENQQANETTTASKLTLSAVDTDLKVLLDKVYEQTGNRLVDYRDQFGQDTQPRIVSVDIAEEEFWPAIDKILDQARLSLYPFSGEESLAVIEREQGAAPRVGKASYAGPFRVEATSVIAQRGLRTPVQQGTRIELEIAWEPRLRPIAISQAVEQIKITADNGIEIPLANSQAVLEVEVQPGNHATELTIPMALPPRSVLKLASIKGQFSALVPGRVAEFRFTELHKTKDAKQQRGGVTVTVDRVRKSQELWEIHMRLRVDSEEAGLESHRGWVFQNLTYLLNKNNEIIDHAGFETTMQSENEVGLAYLFELPDDDIANYTWVYRTPAAITRVLFDYELTDIPLP